MVKVLTDELLRKNYAAVGAMLTSKPRASILR